MSVKSARSFLFISLSLLLLASCGAGDETTTGKAERAAPRSSGDTRAAIEEKVAKATGPEYVVADLPSPCRILTAAVAQNILNVREVVADPDNDSPGDKSPRCAYRDTEGLGKSVSIHAANLPYMFFNSSLSANALTPMIDQQFPAGARYAPADFGPGAARFVAEADDAASMFIMSGLGVAGGDTGAVQAEAAFVVAITDPARTQEQRLTEARNLGVAFNSELINVAEKRSK
ncbi:MAG: hypothetical protein HKN14_06020 [Marinicaulis sp.]|nr:hypothetical protein [Marinicaulis sp.]